MLIIIIILILMLFTILFIDHSVLLLASICVLPDNGILHIVVTKQ